MRCAVTLCKKDGMIGMWRKVTIRAKRVTIFFEVCEEHSGRSW